MVLFEDPMLWSPDRDPDVINECSHLTFVHTIMHYISGVHRLHDLHEEDFCKCSTLCAPCNDAIEWYGVPWVCVVALKASSSHVHLEPQCHKHSWVPESESKLDQFDNVDIVVELFHIKEDGPIMILQVYCSFVHQLTVKC